MVAKKVSELVDIPEIVHRIAELKGTNIEEMEILRQLKAMERGNLAKNYILANFTKMFFLDLKGLKTSLILVTVEIACILTAETVELIFYKRSIFFVNSIGLSCRLIYCSSTRSVHQN